MFCFKDYKRYFNSMYGDYNKMILTYDDSNGHL